VSGELSHSERGVRSEVVAARVMNWTYLIILLAVLAVAGGVVPVVALAPGHRLRAGRRLAVARTYELRPLALLDEERITTCIVCGCPVADEQTHWRAIHHVPA